MAIRHNAHFIRGEDEDGIIGIAGCLGQFFIQAGGGGILGKDPDAGGANVAPVVVGNAVDVIRRGPGLTLGGAG